MINQLPGRGHCRRLLQRKIYSTAFTASGEWDTACVTSGGSGRAGLGWDGMARALPTLYLLQKDCHCAATRTFHHVFLAPSPGPTRGLDCGHAGTYLARVRCLLACARRRGARFRQRSANALSPLRFNRFTPLTFGIGFVRPLCCDATVTK